MNQMIEKYKSAVKQDNKHAYFFGILAIITLFALLFDNYTRPNIEKNQSILVEYCQYYPQFSNGKVGPLEVDPLLCNKVLKMQNVIESYSSIRPQKPVSFIEISYACLFGFFIFISLYFYSKTNVKSFFELNDHDFFLYQWICELKYNGHFSCENDFLNWISTEQHRYTKREIDVMLLAFIK